MNPIANDTLSQKIADHITTQIVEGKISPGERLLEKELTEIYGTSRAPIREALYILENQGIVERVPRKGVFARKYSYSEIEEFYDVVYELTRYAVCKGIDSTDTDDKVKELDHLLNKVELSISKEDFRISFDYIEEIHEKIFEISNNRVLLDLYDKLNKQWTTFRYITLSHPESLMKSIKEYRNIYLIIVNKDKSKIEDVLLDKKTRALSVLKKLS
ncbi:hypothetical protein CR194_09100 [Salipaludibacillus keqinensis]|uniref:HTH gntR-type domain-containing protein n=1 Tax=Salipaludibacillus keqinensis TaxID=2045207 RepID=A0A323TEA6_9BACI|nr:GntR family transcriptional regulator [Salipaludibacillus keqinensis]PYZ93339.1 hypothetical protein CR194_09100 [Salipaludibacillus keqinensis]